jgi:hypothetical protein
MDMSKYYGIVFLKVDDIKTSGPIRVKIAGIEEGRFGKPNLMFEDGSQLSLNATDARVLARVYGTNSDHWIDKQVKLALGEISYQGTPQETILVEPILPAVENKAPPKPAFNKAPAKSDMDDDIPF